MFEEARVVRQIFESVGRDRLSIGEVCRRLLREGIPSPRGKSYWDRSTVWAILRNPAYKGSAAFGKTRSGPRRARLRAYRGQAEQPRRAYALYDVPCDEWTFIPVPAIVDEDLFNAAAEQRAENRHRRQQQQRRGRHLLQGLLACACCGHAFYGKPVSLSSGKGKRRDYAYYRCIGTDAYRFGGHRICQNKQVRTDLLETAVWVDICSLLNEPERIEQEYQRRLYEKKDGRRSGSLSDLAVVIQRLRRAIARLIDAYGDGLLERTEFEPRIRNARDRLAKLEAEAKTQTEQETQKRDIRLAIGQLQDFADRVKQGLGEADWMRRREIVQALVKRVEVGIEGVRVVYRVAPDPFADSPDRGIMQHCWRRDLAAAGQRVPALCAGRVVRAGGSTTAGRSSVSDPVRGRLRDRLQQRVGRPAGHGGAAEAIRQVRSDPPPGEDASGRVSTAH